MTDKGLADKKVYVGKLGKEVVEKAQRLGFKGDTRDLEKMPFLIFVGGFNTIQTLFYIDAFNDHPFKEVTPEWILNLPEERKTYREFGNNIVNGFSISCGEAVHTMSYPANWEDTFKTNLLPTEEEVLAYDILPTLLYWRDKYNEGWKPNWTDDVEKKFYIEFYNNNLNTGRSWFAHKLFAFKTSEIRNQFLEDFKEELEIIKPLL